MQAVNTGLVHVIVQPADKGTNFYQLAAHKAHGWLVLRLLYIFHICLSVGLCDPTSHMHNNYMHITYCISGNSRIKFFFVVDSNCEN